MKVSPGQFARAVGMQRDALYKQLQAGKLGAAATRDGRGRWWIDPQKASDVLGQSLEFSPPQPVTLESGEKIPDMEESRARMMFWRAKIAERRFRDAAASLAPTDEVRAAYVREVESCRAALLKVPDRWARQVKVSARAMTLLRSLFEEALEDLGRGAP